MRRRRAVLGRRNAWWLASHWCDQPIRVGPPLLQPRGKGVAWHGFGNAIALCYFASELQQQSAMGFGFHPFGNHVSAKGLRQTHDAAQDGLDCTFPSRPRTKLWSTLSCVTGNWRR